MKWDSAFASQALRREYQEELLDGKILMTRIMVSLAALFNLSFFLLDKWAIPSALAEVWLVRICLFGALAFVFGCTWHRDFSRLYPLLIAFVILAMGSAINTMIFLAAPTDLARDVYYGGLLLTTIGLYTMTYVGVYFSLALSIVLIGSYAGIAVLIHGYAASEKVVVLTANLFFFVSTTVIGMVAQSVRERYLRENYLLRHSLQRDVEIKEEEKNRAAYLAEHDALTGLPNRVRFDVDAAALMASANASGDQTAFMFIDLDGFKVVNDTHGHAVGDRVLKVVATRLSQCLRHGDIVCRLGGDEFVVAIIVPQEHEDVIDAVGDKIVHAIGEQIVLRGHTLRLSASIGVACAPRDGADLESVLRIADKLMYQIKKTGKAGVAQASAFSTH